MPQKEVRSTQGYQSLLTVGLFCIYMCVNVCVGYSGTRPENSEDPQHAEDYTRDYMTSDYTEPDIAGLTEEEQIEMAIRNSLNDRGKRDK